ncbi:MAG: PfkB family carbohydrate kinase [Vicinamibacterales bacterium]|nr:PfkB family carbohydrate kinase [Vicinamibacterales bacterium]
MLDVVGVGTNSLDDVVVTRSGLLDVISSGKARVDLRQTFSGGQTATAMCACSAWGLKAAYIGVFGSDENGTMVRRDLETRGVSTGDAVVADSPNRTAVIVIDGSGDRTVLWHRSERLSLPPARLDAGVLRARIVHVDDDDPAAALRAASIARQTQTPVTSDIEHVGDRTEELIAGVTYPIFNEHLPIAMTGESDPERALRKLRRLNPGVLCVTLGERGAAALEGDRFHLARAFSVDVADNTGAGDLFRAGFIYGLLNGWSVPDILRFSNAAAAACCRKLGAIPSVPTLDEVRGLL